jgi:hypothetical protein
MSKRLVGGAVLAFVGLALAGCSSSSTSATTTTAAAKATTTTSTTSTTVAAPAGTTGAATPQDIGTAFLAAIQSSDPSSFCDSYVVSDQVSNCKSDVSQSGSTFKGMAMGQVQVDGSQAIVNITGTICQGAQCASNSDPNSAMSDGTSFSDAFAAANDPNDSNSSPFVAAAVLVNGRWYASGF